MNQCNKRPGLLALAALAVCALLPANARADADKKQQAREHYEKATRLYDVGKYSEAISEYEEAYLLIEDAALLFNIGQAYRLWDRPDEALRSYKNYLRRRPEASNRDDVEKKIADLEKVIDERRRGVTAPPIQPAPAAAPSVEPGAASLPPPTLPPLPGPPQQEAPIYAPAPSNPVEVAAAPPKLPEATAAMATPPTAPPAQPRNWLAYGLLGGGGVCLIGAGIAMYVGHSKAQKLRDAASRGETFDPAVQSNGKTANGVAFLTGLVGIASSAVGGYLLWRGRASAPKASVAAVVMPGFSGGSAMLTF